MAKLILITLFFAVSTCGFIFAGRITHFLLRRWINRSAQRSIELAKRVFTLMRPEQSFRMAHHFQSGLASLEYSLVAMVASLEKKEKLSILFAKALLAKRSWQLLNRSLMDFGRLYFGRISEIEFHIRMKGLYHDHCCYLCSKPLTFRFRSRAKLAVEGRFLQVRACGPCRESLRKNSKAQILYFFQQGRRLHWMEIEDSAPAVRYWNVNI